jgi:hypothetical protein
MATCYRVDRPVSHSFTLPDMLTAGLLPMLGACLSTPHRCDLSGKHRSAAESPPVTPSSIPMGSPPYHVGCRGSSLDVLENLPTEAPGQVAFGHLEDEVPDIPEEMPASFEQPLLHARVL